MNNNKSVKNIQKELEKSLGIIAVFARISNNIYFNQYVKSVKALQYASSSTFEFSDDDIVLSTACALEKEAAKVKYFDQEQEAKFLEAKEKLSSIIAYECRKKLILEGGKIEKSLRELDGDVLLEPISFASYDNYANILLVYFRATADGINYKKYAEALLNANVILRTNEDVIKKEALDAKVGEIISKLNKEESVAR